MRREGNKNTYHQRHLCELIVVNNELEQVATQKRQESGPIRSAHCSVCYGKQIGTLVLVENKPLLN